MPKNKQPPFTMLDSSPLSKPAKAKSKYSPISQYDFAGTLSSAAPTASEVDLQTEKSTSPKKSAEQQAEEKFEKLVKKAKDEARKQANADLLKHILRDRVREALAAEFGARMPVSELERYVHNCTRSVIFELQEIKCVPASIQHNMVTTTVEPGFLAEPKDPEFDDDDEA